MNNILLICGKAGSGKDTLAKKLCKNQDFALTTAATTRPKREYEKQGVDYYFLTEKEFIKTPMVECSVFNGWMYGTPYSSLTKDKINVIVTNPRGIQNLVDTEDNIKIIELEANDKTRLLRQLNREKNPNVKEIIRRFQTDDKDFDDFHKWVKDNRIPMVVYRNENKQDLYKILDELN